MKTWHYAVAGLIGLLALVALAAACNDSGESYILLHGTPVDPTCSFVASQVVVRFKDERPTALALTMMSEHGAERIKVSPYSGAWLLKVDPDERDDLIEALSRDPGVEYASLNHLGSAPERRPCDSLTSVPTSQKRD